MSWKFVLSLLLAVWSGSAVAKPETEVVLYKLVGDGIENQDIFKYFSIPSTTKDEGSPIIQDDDKADSVELNNRGAARPYPYYLNERDPYYPKKSVKSSVALKEAPTRGGATGGGLLGIELFGGGFPLEGFPPGRLPLGGFPVGGFPVGGLPIGGFPVGGLPEGEFPVGGLPVGGFPVGGLPVGGFPVGGLPGGEHPGGGLLGVMFPGGGKPLGYASFEGKPLGAASLVGKPLEVTSLARPPSRVPELWRPGLGLWHPVYGFWHPRFGFWHPSYGYLPRNPYFGIPFNDFSYLDFSVQ